MKSRSFLLFISALLIIAFFSMCAYADNAISSGLGTYSYGEEVSQLIVTTDSGSAGCVAGALPYGCYISSEVYPDGIHHILRGTPSAAGYYEFTISITDASGYSLVAVNCSLSVTPSAPQVSVCSDIQTTRNSGTSIYVSAYSPSGDYLSYQWYVSLDRSRYGSMLHGETSSSLYLPCTEAGTFYYYCQVTSNNNGMTTSVYSDFITAYVSAPTVSSVYVYNNPYSVNYKVNDTVNTNGLQLAVRYSNGTEEYISSGFTVSPTYLTNEGQQYITVRYNGYECGYYVNVEADKEVIQNIGIISSPHKTNYNVGDRFEPNGLTIRVYTNKSSYDITSGYSYYPEYLNAEGSQTITVTYEGISTTFEVYAQAPSSESISIAVMPKLRSFTVGDTLDTTGMVITVTNGNDKKDIITGFSCTPSILTKAGTQEIVVTYNDSATRFYVTVNEASSSSQNSEGQVAGSEVITNRVPSKDSGPKVSPVIVAVLIIAILSLAALCATAYISQNKAAREKFERFIRRFDR